MIDRIPITSREQWLSLREQDVTASVVAALLDAGHPYMTSLKLFYIKGGVQFPEDDVDDAVKERGIIFEPSVPVAVGRKRSHWKMTKAEHYYRDPDTRIGATPDFYIESAEGGFGVLQTKTASPQQWRDNYQEGTYVPPWIQMQASTEAMLVGADFWAVGVLKIDAYDPAVLIESRERLPALEANIRYRVKKFWADFDQGIAPKPDYAKDAEMLAQMAPPSVPGKTINLAGDNYLPILLQERDKLVEKIAEVKPDQERKKEIEAEIKHKMGDAERIEGVPGWTVTWKTAIDGSRRFNARKWRDL